MKNKLFLYTFISSPLLALFGAGPLYIFGVLDLQQITRMYVSLLLSVVIYWIINGYLFIKLKKKITWQMLLLSYVVTFFSNILKAPLAPYVSFLEVRDILEQYLVYPIITTLALNTIILLIINLIIGEREKRAAQQTIADLNMRKLEAENQVLMQQLQPHFLFNALSILKSLIKEDANLAEEYSIKLSEFLRYAVDSHATELVSIQDEMQFVNNYIELQQIRFENAFEFQVNIPTEVYQAKVPVLAIQVLVENTFKHNYFTEKRPLQIAINYADEHLEVFNNLVSVKLTERAGTGLSNLEKRYQFITGKEILVTPTETTFSVKIPVIRA